MKNSDDTNFIDEIKESLEEIFTSYLGGMKKYLEMNADGDNPLGSFFKTLNELLTKIDTLNENMRKGLYDFINDNYSLMQAQIKENISLIEDKWIDYELIYKHNLGGWLLILFSIISTFRVDIFEKLLLQLERIKQRALDEKNEKFIVELYQTFFSMKGNSEINETILQMACREKFAKGNSIFFLFLELRFSDPLDKNKQALHLIASHPLKNDEKNASNIKFILDNGYLPYLNQPDSTGKTPLQNAIKHNNALVVKSFLEAGAVTSDKDLSLAKTQLENSEQIFSLMTAKLGKQQSVEPVAALAKSMSQLLSLEIEDENATYDRDSITNQPW